MKDIKFLALLFVLFACTKDTTKPDSKDTGKLKSDSEQEFYYTEDKIDYILNKGYGANKMKYFYSGDYIEKIELYNVNGHIHTLYFTYEGEKLIKIVDSFVLWNSSSNETHITTYEHISQNEINATITTYINGLPDRTDPVKYTLYIKDQNLYKIQWKFSVDSFLYDEKTNPRYYIAGLNKLIDFRPLEYAGIDWIQNCSKNNLTKSFWRSNTSSNYATIRDYFNFYDYEGKLIKKSKDTTGNNLWFKYEYY